MEFRILNDLCAMAEMLLRLTGQCRRSADREEDHLVVASLFNNPRVAAVNCRIWLARYGYMASGAERMHALKVLAVAAKAYMTLPSDERDADLRRVWLVFQAVPA